MILLLTYLVELQVMLAFFQSLRIYKHTCKYILIRDFIEMAQEYINQKLFSNFTPDKTGYHIIIEEH